MSLDVEARTIQSELQAIESDEVLTDYQKGILDTRDWLYSGGDEPDIE